MTRLGAVLVAALALWAAGCGGGADTPREAVDAYLEALADRDGDKACEQLAADARDRLERGSGSCKDAIEFIAALIPKDRRDEVKETEVEVDQEGDTATASFPAPFAGGAAGAPAQTQRVELRKEDGDWKITDLGTSAGG